MRYCGENRKLCDIALTAHKCCLWSLSVSLFHIIGVVTDGFIVSVTNLEVKKTKIKLNSLGHSEKDPSTCAEYWHYKLVMLSFIFLTLTVTLLLSQC